jgi:hypothetical protein
MLLKPDGPGEEEARMEEPRRIACHLSPPAIRSKPVAQPLHPPSCGERFSAVGDMPSVTGGIAVGPRRHAVGHSRYGRRSSASCRRSLAYGRQSSASYRRSRAVWSSVLGVIPSVTGGMVVSPRRHAASHRRYGRRSSASCHQSPAVSPSVLGDMPSITGGMVAGPRHHAAGHCRGQDQPPRKSANGLGPPLPAKTRKARRGTLLPWPSRTAA